MTAVAPQRAPAERVLRPERRSEEQLHLPDEAALDKGACHQRRPGGVEDSLVVVLVARGLRGHHGPLGLQRRLPHVAQHRRKEGMARRGAKRVLADGRRRAHVAQQRRVRLAVDFTLKRKDAARLRRLLRVLHEELERLREQHVRVQVEAAVVIHGQVAEEVDALYRRVRQRVVERLPLRHALGDEGSDVGVVEEEVRPARVQLTHLLDEQPELLRHLSRAMRLDDEPADRRIVASLPRVHCAPRRARRQEHVALGHALGRLHRLRRSTRRRPRVCIHACIPTRRAPDVLPQHLHVCLREAVALKSLDEPRFADGRLERRHRRRCERGVAALFRTVHRVRQRVERGDRLTRYQLAVAADHAHGVAGRGGGSGACALLRACSFCAFHVAAFRVRG
mmetsp:Transcript_32726/g.71844  ORF Transcript_32726/g.71844 Transcript_32726/m.71844 type:complete len:394 (-) Transcript_32726:225-1406(-)